MKKTRGGVQSLHRAFDILAVVARHDVIGATQIAKELELSVSTVNNLSRTMADRGYLIGQRGQYSIGPGFSIPASKWNPMFVLPELVRPALRELALITGQAAVATVLVGMDARVLSFEQGRGPVGTPPPREDRKALHLPSGAVQVALSRKSQWTDFVNDCVAESDGAESAESLFEELDEISRTYVCGRRSVQPHGQTAIAVPVWSAAESMACALGVSAPTYLVDDALVQEIWTALTRIAAELSERLGADYVPSVARDFTWRATH